MEFYAFGEAVGKLNLKIAVVSRIDGSIEDAKLFENVATNRGSQMRHFDTEQDAKDWLDV